MKYKGVFVCAAVLLSVVTLHAQPQNGMNPDSVKNQLDRLAASKDPAVLQLLNSRLKALAASSREDDMGIAASYYFRINNTKAFDSVVTAAIRKFPRGLEARSKAQQEITRMKSLPEMEEGYRAFVKNFPPGNYPRLSLGEDRLPYDRIRYTLAKGYAMEKNEAKTSYYAGLLEADFWKRKPYHDLSDIFHASGDLTNAALYQKKAVEATLPYAEGKMGNSTAAKWAASGYAEMCAGYARILYEQKKYPEALKYIEIADNAANGRSTPVNFTYANILAALNRDQDAYDKIEMAVRSGETTEEMWDVFRKLYERVKGSNAGLETVMEDIRKGAGNDLKERLMKKMISEPAVDFTLTDLNGKKVTLSDFKGKIVILDFWATWCVPCKASFPAMQMAVDKYKDDPDVKFLFIHTWERTADPAADARAYIAGMKYDFRVLMDTKDPETKANKVVADYHVSGIPAKFLIDGKGNIRFKLTGFNSSRQAAVDEISLMVDMVRSEK